MKKENSFFKNINGYERVFKNDKKGRKIINSLCFYNSKLDGIKH